MMLASLSIAILIAAGIAAVMTAALSVFEAVASVATREIDQ